VSSLGPDPTNVSSERPYGSNEDLLNRLDQWLAKRGGTATFEDIMQSGDHLLFAAFLLRGFRKAAREAVFDRFKLEAGKHGFPDAKPSTRAFFYMIDRIADAWLVTDQEKVALLGADTRLELDAMREAPFQDVSPETLERGAILLDIFIYLGAILPETEVADEWVRLPNSAPLFGGKTALMTMLDGGLEMLRAVRVYLRDEATGNWKSFS
jgi:hypothetical protein